MFDIRKTPNGVQNLFQIVVKGAEVLLWIHEIIVYRKKIMPHPLFLLPENKKHCKIKRILHHYFSQLTLH